MALNLDTTQLLAIAAAMGWASGLRLYAVVFLTGLAGFLGWVPLPEGLKLLQHPLMLGASALMLAAEFLANRPGCTESRNLASAVSRCRRRTSSASVEGRRASASSRAAAPRVITCTSAPRVSATCAVMCALPPKP